MIETPTAVGEIVTYNFDVYAVDYRAALTEGEREFMGLPGAQRYEVTDSKARQIGSMFHVNSGSDMAAPDSREPRWIVTVTAQEIR